MNDRIMELAVIAGLIVEEYNGFDRAALKPAEEKFARLIIEECVGYIRNRKSIAVADEWNVEEAMTCAEDDILRCFE